jgi:hypothetical protein
MVVESYHRESTTGPATTDSSAMTVIVALIAILFIIGLGLFALRSSGYNFGTAPTRSNVNVDLNTGNGAANPGVGAGDATGAPANP